eukprot:NODE_377_length_3107_cov_12.557718.p1 GENE.NODE_377_length_3107_cov_12.557718~~NODE_377_length_3107_cov_12.557718.p1  ORF type:complete len:890 (-),score=226.51 NODE_377_length_3107_cov_12.557718:437-3031(-)
MPVRFPKHIAIEDHRLSKVWWCLLIVFATILLFQLFYLEGYFTLYDTGALTVVLWGVISSKEDAASYDVDAELCTDPTQFDYCHDLYCDVAYLDQTCMSMCDGEAALENCTAWWEVSMESQARDSIMLATHFVQNFMPTEANIDRSLLPRLSNHFTTEFHRHSLAFKYTQVLPEYYFYNEHIFSSQDDIFTVLLNSDYEVMDTYEPSASVSLTWDIILQAAGRSTLMSDTLPEAGYNFYEDTTAPDGPITRIAGIEIDLKVDCTNNPKHYVATDVELDWDGPVCMVMAVIPDTPVTWPVYERVFPSLGGTALRVRRYHGIRIVAVATAALYYFDPLTFYLWVVSSSVVMVLPSHIMRLMAVLCLGSLSKVYKKVIYEPFCIRTELRSTAIMLLSGACSFHQLADFTEGISKERFSTWMVDALKDESALNHNEVCRMVDVCYEQVLTVTTNSCHFPKIHHQKDGTPEANSVAHHVLPKYIDADSYLSCYMLESRVGFTDMVTLFDMDQKRTFLERFFMPLALRALATTRTAIEPTHLMNIHETFTQVRKEAEDPVVAAESGRTMSRGARLQVDTLTQKVVGLAKTTAKLLELADDETIFIGDILEERELAGSTNVQDMRESIATLQQEVAELRETTESTLKAVQSEVGKLSRIVQKRLPWQNSRSLMEMDHVLEKDEAASTPNQQLREESAPGKVSRVSNPLLGRVEALEAGLAFAREKLERLSLAFNCSPDDRDRVDDLASLKSDLCTILQRQRALEERCVNMGGIGSGAGRAYMPMEGATALGRAQWGDFAVLTTGARSAGGAQSEVGPLFDPWSKPKRALVRVEPHTLSEAPASPQPINLIPSRHGVNTDVAETRPAVLEGP